jgi:hypothetical protein
MLRCRDRSHFPVRFRYMTLLRYLVEGYAIKIYLVVLECVPAALGQGVLNIISHCRALRVALLEPSGTSLFPIIFILS